MLSVAIRDSTPEQPPEWRIRDAGHAQIPQSPIRNSVRALRWLACLGLSLSACGSEAIAADCVNLLVADFTLASADATTDLAYLALVSPANFERHKANSYPKMGGGGPPHMSAATALPIASALLHASATYADFASKREHAYAEHQFHYMQADLAGFFTR